MKQALPIMVPTLVVAVDLLTIAAVIGLVIALIL